MPRLGPPAAAVAIALFAGVPTARAQGQLQPAEAPTTPPPAFSAKGLIVQWADGADHADKVGARDDAEVEFASDLGNREFQLVEVEPGQSPRAAIAALEADPTVALAERDSYDRTEAVPNDPLFSWLWALQNTGRGMNGFAGAVPGDDIDVVSAWDRTVGTPNTVIADIDSGYRFEQPDLGPVAWTNPGEIPGNHIDDDHNGFVDDVHGWDFVGADGEAISPDNDPSDDDLVSGGHGVHTAGTMGAAGDNGIGITGVSRNARIMPLRICTRFPREEENLCWVSAEVAAINYAGEMHARAANMSLGGTEKTQSVANALASNPGTLFVIAAGNDGQDNDVDRHYPCDFNPEVDAKPPAAGAIDNVICVAATDQADGLASFSDYGSTTVDLGAPGTQIFSTYATAMPFSDNFESDDFASRWISPAGKAGFGRAASGDGPLTSFGMTDSPGTPAAAGTLREVLSPSIAVPAGVGSCQIKGIRFKKGGSFSYGLTVSGGGTRTFSPGDSGSSKMMPFSTEAMSGLAGRSVQLFFRYTASANPGPDDGVWLDEVRLTCAAPVGAAEGYEFLEGTSMATPQVTGAAGLLFSLKPSATVTEVRQALLGSVAETPALAGRTVTGGRLDVAAALAELVPPGSETVSPETEITDQPPASTTSTTAAFSFRRSDADASTFECKLDEEAFAACSSPDSFAVDPGIHSFQVRARAPDGMLDPSPAAMSWTVVAPEGEEDGSGSTEEGSGNNGEESPDNGGEPEGGGGSEGGEQSAATPPAAGSEPSPRVVCVVPRLVGRRLAAARVALAAAGCRLDGVTRARSRRRPGGQVVKSSRPPAGARAAAGTVALTLGPKPKRRGHHR